MLDRQGTTIDQERSTKNPLSESEVRDLLAQVRTVVIAKGRKAESRPAKDVAPDDLRGPTGNFRAPIVRRGDRLLVGFHLETLETLL